MLVGIYDDPARKRERLPLTARKLAPHKPKLFNIPPHPAESAPEEVLDHHGHRFRTAVLRDLGFQLSIAAMPSDGLFLG